MNIIVPVDALIAHRFLFAEQVDRADLSNCDTWLQTVCAFANDLQGKGGGIVLFPLPQDESQAEAFAAMRQTILLEAEQIDPPLCLRISQAQFQKQLYLLVWARPCQNRRYVLRNPDGTRTCWVRWDSWTMPADREVDSYLKERKHSMEEDDMSDAPAALCDLDKELLADFFRRIDPVLGQGAENSSRAELAKILQISLGVSPSRLGLLLFAKKPSLFFHWFRTEIVWIPDPTRDGMEEMVLEGTLPRQYQDAAWTVSNRFCQQKIFKRNQRIESERIWNYPPSAVRLLLMFMYCHHSSHAHEPMTVTVRPEQMEFTFFCDYEPVHEGSDRHLHRRQLLAVYNMFCDDFLIDTKEILDANGSPDLIVEDEPYSRAVTLIVPIHPAFSECSTAETA